MTLIVYKDKTGAITRAEELPASLKDSAAALTEFNQKNAEKLAAEFVEAPEGSLIEHLYRSQKLRIKDFREELQDIQTTLNELYGRLDWIEERFGKDDSQ